MTDLVGIAPDDAFGGLIGFRERGRCSKTLRQHRNYRAFVYRKSSSRANVNGKSRPRPSKNGFPYVAPLRLSRDFNDNHAWFGRQSRAHRNERER
jgi:hypothetical protein